MNSCTYFDDIPTALAVSEFTEGRIVDVNKAWLDLIGFNKKDEVAGKTGVELGLFPDFPLYEQLLNAVRLNNGFANKEIWYTMKGLRKCLLVSGNKINIDGVDFIMTSYQEITVLKKIESELRDKEQHLRIALDAANLGTWTFELKTGKAVHSFRHSQIFGYSEFQSDWSFEKYLQHILPEYRHIAKDAVRNALRTGELSYEVKISRMDGSIRWIELTGRAQYDDLGEPFSITGVIADINERKLAEELLQASEKRYSALFSNKINGMAHCRVLYDDSGKPLNYKILQINEAYERITGIKKSEIEGKLATEAFPDIKSYKIDYINMYGRLARERSEIRFEEFFEGSGQYLSVYAYSPEPDEFIAIFTDVTDRIKAEKSLRYSESQYKTAQKRLEIALENANIGLWEWDLKKNELLLDEKTEKIFGLGPGTFGKTLNAFEDLINEEDIQHIRNATEKALKGIKPYETVFRTRSGRNGVRYISSKAFITRDANGDQLSLTGVCFDVTALREDTERVISRLNEELLRSNKELEDFAYVASHDLQEPLRMVTSFTQLLSNQYGDKLDEKAKEYIYYAVDGSKRMYDLLNGLLAYSRVKTRGQEFSKVGMQDVIDKVKGNLRLKIQETHTTINHKDLPEVFADRNQMIQLFQNLIENSIKFNRKSPVISISAQVNDENIVFSVSDNGIGIEQQYSDRIFRIFQRLHARNEYEGMGVGLSICQRIVERHGGRIWIERGSSEGVTFSFTIPRRNLNY